MNDPLWRPSHRRPHSASSVATGSSLFSRPSSRSSPRPEPNSHGQTNSPELDFTDKLKALRELIASSKGHRHARESAEKTSSRIMVRRSGLSDAKEVGEKLQFTVNSLERKNLHDITAEEEIRSEKERIRLENVDSRNSFVHEKESYSDHYVDPELFSAISDQKRLRPRPHSAVESYNGAVSRDVKQTYISAEQGWVVADHAFDSNGIPASVSSRKEYLPDKRTQYSQNYYDHEVPERDWNIPSKTHNSYADASSRKHSAERKQNVVRFGSVIDRKGQDLLKEKEAIYQQYSPRENASGSSPPEHDYPSTGNARKPVQTNVQFSGKSSRVKVRPHSADPTKSSAEVKKSTQVRSGSVVSKDNGHWTQLLSQKRDRHETRSVPSSPGTVQSNVSAEIENCLSPRAFLLQEVASQLELERQQTAIMKHKHSHKHGKYVLENGDDVLGTEEKMPDEEVANILQHPVTKKKIIIKRGSVRVVHETDSNSQVLHDNHKRHNVADTKSVPKSKSKPDFYLDIGDDAVPEIAKEDHILTLDKLKSLLRGRKSESRPSSQASTTSMSSPSPLKAFHHTKPPKMPGREPHASHEHPAHGKSDDLSSKPPLRKVIKRPSNVSKPKEDSHKSVSSSSQQVDQIAADSRTGVEVQRKSRSEKLRSSSASIFSRLSSSSAASSAKSSSASKQGQVTNTGNKTGKDERLNHGMGRSKSAIDFTKQNGDQSEKTVASAHSLRSSVKRLHQEVSMRVNQDAYIVQGIMNSADELEEDPHVNDTKMGQVRQRLSFDEDGAVTAEKSKISSETRSQSCIPFGKRLGVGMVDTGSLPRHSLNMVDVPQKDKNSYIIKSSSTGNQPYNTESDEKHFVTSTPKRNDSLPWSISSQSSISYQNSHSGAVREGLIRKDLLPEKESSNLRQRRPASVGAIPIQSSSQVWAAGLPAGSDAADLIVSQLGNAGMVHLLQQLYSADDATRQGIITKAQYFKRWQNTAHCLRHQRQVYAESLKRAHKFLIRRLQRRCFLYWRTAADENRKNRMADSIHRHHMLKKGLQGFSWAIMRSKHQTRTLQTKVSSIVIRAAFTKWHARFEFRREERFRTAFTRWREFAYEEKSVREMQRNQNEKLIYQTMLTWKEAYSRRIKENIADKYLRRTSLRQSWRAWFHFTNSSREKAHRESLALDLRKRNMQRSTMHAWKVTLSQCRRASQHFRMRRLHRTLQAWRQGAQISRVERQRDMATSLEHWRHTTTRHTFIRWHQQLHQCRAISMANRTLSRKTFDFWRQEWQRNMQRRQEIEAAITSSRLHKCLLTWRRNVVDRRRKQKQAVYLLETCLMHVTLLEWRRYTAYKTGFRANLQHHVTMIHRTTLSRCFYTWRDQLHVRLDERRRRELWSLSCVRKMTAHWRHKCHVRHLDNMLEETEPIRELGLLKRMFFRWLAAKGQADEENVEVMSSRHILQRCSLQRHFQTWRLAAQRALTIRPLVLRQQRQLVTWCFDAWHQYVRSRMEIRNREKLFQKCQLSRAFTRWRRQFHCQQVSRLAQQSLMQRLALCLLQEWRAILHRKHQAQLYHCCNLLRHSFHHWKRRTRLQLRERAAEQAEQELSQELKQHCFNSWWSGVQAQIADNNDAIARLQQRKNHNHMRSFFSAWRRSLHAHVISRAYQQSATLRLLRSVLLEWHEAASQSLCSAVQHFAQQIGLQQAAGGAVVDGHTGELGNSLEFADLQHFEDLSQHASPCSSSAASLKHLFASDHSTASEHMSGSEFDLDRAALLSSGLWETIEERRQKNLRLQELSILFVTRLRHWPISLAFGQWLEYTLRQRHLRELAQEVEDKHQALMVSMAFQRWTVHLADNQKATNMRNWKLRHGSLMGLLTYSRHRKVKAMLAQRARSHLVKKVLGKIFPWWFAKAQEQRHQRTILHLWTTATPEEKELLPMEASLSRQIRHRSLRTCLQVWRVRYLFIIKLKKAYHWQLLGRVLTTWQNWASLRQEQQRKGENFLQARRKRLTFRTWCERLHQKRETERRYQVTLEGHQRQAFVGWRYWARMSKQHRQSRQVLETHFNLMCVRSHFMTWHRLTLHAHTIRNAHNTRLMQSVLLSWHQATQEGKQLRQTILSFQAASLARLVGHLFRQWQLFYRQQQQLHLQREERAQQSALHCGREWRRKAQATRGRKLIVVFKYNLLSRMFRHWQLSLTRVEELKQRQAVYVGKRKREVMRCLLGEWRQRLQSTLVARNFSHRLLVTVMDAWQVFAKASKERRIRGLALQHALLERNLRVYFLYWRQMSVRVRSLQNNVEVRLQLRVLQAWSYVVRRRCSQRRLGEKFVRLHQHRMMASAFTTIRSRFDYCQGLKEIADSMCARRDRCIALLAMERWKGAVDNVLADRFHQRLLCVRTARQWLRFVVRVKADRQHELEQHTKAVTHHNKKICLAVIEVLKQEVKVKQQLQKRRQRLAVKFATNWKHITDMSVTAVIMEEERLFSKYWRCWRLAWVRQQAANRDTALHRRQILTQVFTAWSSLCPSRTQPSSNPILRRAKVITSDSGRDSPTTPRSFLPVPVTSARRSAFES